MNIGCNESKQDSDESDSDNQPDTHIRAQHTLDPKVIHTLEMEILKAMAGNNQLDGKINLPDASIAPSTSTNSSAASSLFNNSQSFTMESFTVDSIDPSLTVSEIDMQEANPRPKKPVMCCRRPQPSQVQIVSQSELEPPPVVGQNKATELLPPQSNEDKGKITLVLDLDETLVHSSFLAIPHADFRFILKIDSNPVGVFVCVRPGAERFLKELGPFFEIVIFTASCQTYADTVIDFIDKAKVVKHRLYRESCTDFGGNFVKDLSRLNRSLEKIIIIDNSSVAYLLQPYNAVGITSWFDDPTDNELFIILDFLKQNHHVKNIYDILVAEPEKQN